MENPDINEDQPMGLPFSQMELSEHGIRFNTGRGFFVSRIIQFGSFNNKVYCIDTVCGWVFNKKNPTSKSRPYICELCNLHILYTTTLFLDHLPNNV